MSASKFRFPLPSKDEGFNYDWSFSCHSRRNPDVSREEYDTYHWAKKVDERINAQDLFEVVQTMTEFYQRIEVSSQQITKEE